ncbi:MAG: hypothetical protein KatS3mg060_3566 [Dehalococcoidia bacterium]|nr:MAG: hypothetical protein KatS3mg060_3566 [Dehalococcoidia bacterium]
MTHSLPIARYFRLELKSADSTRKAPVPIGFRKNSTSPMAFTSFIGKIMINCTTFGMTGFGLNVVIRTVLASGAVTWSILFPVKIVRPWRRFSGSRVRS